MENEEIMPEIVKSNGQLFKEKHGYSKTMKRLMRKYKCKTPEEYRKIRRRKRS